MNVMEKIKGRTALELLEENMPSVFRNFSRKDMADLLAIGTTIELGAFKELQIQNNYKLPEAYIVLSGIIEHRRKGQMIEQYTSGDFIGVSFLHVHYHANGELRTAIPTKLVALRRDEMLRYFRERPEKLFKIFTMNVIDVQHRHIISLHKRVADVPEYKS